jgi:hypothetical protein
MRPLLMPSPVTANGRLPWTRRVALDYWSRSVAMLSLLATSVITLAAAFRGAPPDWDSTLLGLVLVAALPGLWIALARLAERRYLSRPPKPFLAAALGFAFGGVALVAAAVVLLQSQAADADSLMAAGGALEACGTVLLGAWFVAVLAVRPSGDHMHSL